MTKLEDFEECKRLVVANVVAHVERRIEHVDIAQALSRISAEDICSPCNIPAFPTSIKDGYALSSADFLQAGQEFEIQFHSLAGSASLSQALQPGKAVYVTTGSPLPFGANCVVEIEQTELVSDHVVRIHAARLQENSDVRQVGSDLKLFELVIKAGTSIGPGEIGALASIGKFSQIKVFAKPTVGVLATGEELVDGHSHAGGGELPYGHVFDCNRPMLLAAISDLGCLGVDLGILRDSEAGEHLHKVIHKAFIEYKVDVLVTTGGVSVGNADCIRMFLETNADHGFQVLFNRVNVKPGKPVTCAVNSELHQVIFALPGNPVSSLAMFTTLVAPCLRHIKGSNQIECNNVYAQTTCDITLDARPEFQRARLQVDSSGKIYATPTGFQRSSCVMSLVACDALICLPGGGGKLPNGSMVKTLLFSDWRNTTFPQMDVDHMMMYLVRIADDNKAEDKKTALALSRLCPESTVEMKRISKYEDLDELPNNNSLVILIGDGVVDKQVISLLQDIPGIPQFIHERLGTWEEISVRIIGSSLLFDVSQVTQVPIEHLVATGLHLLRAALKKLKE